MSVPEDTVQEVYWRPRLEAVGGTDVKQFLRACVRNRIPPGEWLDIMESLSDKKGCKLKGMDRFFRLICWFPIPVVVPALVVLTLALLLVLPVWLLG